MILKPQDLVVLLKLVVLRGQAWSYNSLAMELGMSPSEVHAATKRALAACLAVKKDGKIVPDPGRLEEFIVHGVRYVFVPDRGGLSRGVPTSFASAPLDSYFAPVDEPPPVWPDPEGPARGVAFSPLYKSAPQAARRDPALRDLLVLVDAIRGGRARERDIATRLLKERLSGQSSSADEGMNNDKILVVGPELSVSREKLEALARRFHIKRLALFGSAARGELRPDSDIDLLVEFEPGEAPSLWGATELEDELSRLFEGRSVDIVPPEVLRNPFRRRTIERDLKVLIDEAA